MTTKKEGEAAPAKQWAVDHVLRDIGEKMRPAEGQSSPVPFFHMLGRLKTTKREGWKRFNIRGGESIADHMYRMSVICMLAPPSLARRLDVAKCVQMSLVHDMAEALVGDITPVDGVPKAEKSRREAEAVDYLSRRLLGRVEEGAPGRRLAGLWREYEDTSCDEAVFVHDVDKIELLLQMVEYEKFHGGRLDLGEFVYVSRNIRLPECKEWAREILADRDAFRRSLPVRDGGGGGGDGDGGRR